jgi:hypothetical protein
MNPRARCSRSFAKGHSPPPLRIRSPPPRTTMAFNWGARYIPSHGTRALEVRSCLPVASQRTPPRPALADRRARGRGESESCPPGHRALVGSSLPGRRQPAGGLLNLGSAARRPPAAVATHDTTWVAGVLHCRRPLHRGPPQVAALGVLTIEDLRRC